MAFENINTPSEARASVQGAMYAAAQDGWTNREALNVSQLVQAIQAQAGVPTWQIINECNAAVGPNGIDPNHWAEVRRHLGDNQWVPGHNGEKPGFAEINTPDEARAVLQGALYCAAGDQFTWNEAKANADLVQAISQQSGLSVAAIIYESHKWEGAGNIDPNHFKMVRDELWNRGERW